MQSRECCDPIATPLIPHTVHTFTGQLTNDDATILREGQVCFPQQERRRASGIRHRFRSMYTCQTGKHATVPYRTYPNLYSIGQLSGYQQVRQQMAAHTPLPS